MAALSLAGRNRRGALQPAQNLNLGAPAGARPPLQNSVIGAGSTPASGPMANPLLDARRPMAVPANMATAPAPGAQLGMAPGARLGPSGPLAAPQQPGAAAPADPRAGIEALYQQMLDANSKMGGQIQDIGQSNIAALQRRNASNAALAGRSIGGGYLGGQRAMLTQGLDQMNKNLLSNDQARQGILAQQLQNRLADQRRDEEWARQDTIRSEEAKAKATQTQREGRGEALKKAFEATVGKLSSHPWVEKNIAEYLATGDESYLNEIQKAIDEVNGQDNRSADKKAADSAADQALVGLGTATTDRLQAVSNPWFSGRWGR